VAKGSSEEEEEEEGDTADEEAEEGTARGRGGGTEARVAGGKWTSTSARSCSELATSTLAVAPGMVRTQETTQFFTAACLSFTLFRILQHVRSCDGFMRNPQRGHFPP